MTRSIKLAVSAALALSATSALATNGDHLIGLGAKSRAMGGTTIGIAHGAESGLSNAALITSVKGTEISFGGTLFMPKVSADMGAGSSDSAADINMIPEVSIASKVNEYFYWGIGMWGTAGMGVDYRDESGYTANMNMVTNLQLMQFGVPLAYKVSGFSIGITPILQYGALDIDYKMPTGQPSPNDMAHAGAGVAQDLAFGFNLGLAYEISGFTVGAIYKSPIEMDYSGQLSAATQPFVDFGIFPGAMEDKLEQPSEMGIGASYAFSGNTIAFDYKKINWSSAKGYEEFGWDDQNVIALGYEYATDSFAIRVGYNRADSPISDAGALTLADAGAAAGGQPTPDYFGGNALNTFNLLGFPATVETHYTLGGTYNVSNAMSLDFAYVYAPETSTKLLTMPDMTNGVDMYTEVTHSQSSVTFQINYAFNN